MRVLIAGATGVIGREAVPRLAAAGHDVIGLSRSPRQSAEAQHLTGDLLDANALLPRCARPRRTRWFMTELRSADNRRARRRLAWAPGHSSWREGLTAELARPAHAA